MKTNLWIIAASMLSAGLLAQTATNPPIETPAAAPMATNVVTEPAAVTNPAATNAPAAKPAKKKGKKKSDKKSAKPKVNTAPLSTEPLMAGPAEVVASSVNVRGQARLKSEIVVKLTKGQQVTVVEEVVRNNSGPDEPSAWAKIILPSSAHAWASSAFIDASNMTVKATRLNLRSGPGENYSVIGHLMHGDTVKQLGTKGDWTEVEPPADAFAFVAAQYLKQGAAAPPASPVSPVTPAKPAEPATTMTAVNESPAVTAATNVPTPATPVDTNPPATTASATTAPVTTAPATTPEMTATNPPPTPEEPPPPRIVQREGRVRGMTSIQAPSAFELISPETGAVLDYLYTTSTNLDLRRYKGLQIIVTGEESLDERWKSTPVLSIEKIQVVD